MDISSTHETINRALVSETIRGLQAYLAALDNPKSTDAGKRSFLVMAVRLVRDSLSYLDGSLCLIHKDNAMRASEIDDLLVKAEARVKELEARVIVLEANQRKRPGPRNRTPEQR